VSSRGRRMAASKQTKAGRCHSGSARDRTAPARYVDNASSSASLGDHHLSRPFWMSFPRIAQSTSRSAYSRYHFWRAQGAKCAFLCRKGNVRHVDLPSLLGISTNGKRSSSCLASPVLARQLRGGGRRRVIAAVASSSTTNCMASRAVPA
jgi:hypothetical protein